MKKRQRKIPGRDAWSGYEEFVVSDAAVGDSDSASPFLHLLVNREERDAGSVAEIYLELQSVVEFVASHQDRHEANRNRYGSFTDLAERLRELCDENVRAR